MDILLWLGLAFLMPFLGIVAGFHYERYMRRRDRRLRPRVLDSDWRGL